MSYTLFTYIIYLSDYFTSSKTTSTDYQKVTNIMVQIW